MAKDEPLTYWEPPPIERQEAEALLASGDANDVTETLIRLAYHEPDWRRVYAYCERYIHHDDSRIRAIAAQCFGLLAVFHKAPPGVEDAIPLLERLLDESDLSVVGQARDALDDIRHQLSLKGKALA